MTCDSYLDGARCVLPEGHDGIHQIGFEGDIPDDVATVIAAVMNETEVAAAGYRKAAMHMRRAFIGLLVAVGANLALLVYNLFQTFG